MLSNSQSINRKPPTPRIEQRKDKDERNSWFDRSDELREWFLFLDQEALEDAGNIIKSLGSGLKGAWSQIREIPRKLFDTEVLDGAVDEDKQERLVRLGETAGLIAGFVAVGGHALGGGLKILHGFRRKDNSRKLDGMMDIATAATIGLTVAGMATARAVMAPVAAAFNIFRGAYNAGHGFKTHDGRKQLQGALDSFRSAGTFGRLLARHSKLLGVAGVILAPIAGCIQAGRGLHDITIGLRNNDNKKEMEGLVDIATAVGTAMAFASGAAIIPGVVLAVAANLVKAGYQISPRVRRKLDPKIDKLEPKLKLVAEKASKLTKPVRWAWKKLWSRFVDDPEAKGPEKISRAQLAELTHLFRVDGIYSRQEERRLQKKLETTGQAADLPKRKDPPLQRDLTALLKELPEKKSREDFFRYLSAAAMFDNVLSETEESYLDEIALTLGLDKPVRLSILSEVKVLL